MHFYFILENHCAGICEEEDTQGEVDSEEEEEYIDADDEDSDCINGGHAGMQGRSIREDNDVTGQASMEYEFVPINIESGQKIRKR